MFTVVLRTEAQALPAEGPEGNLPDQQPAGRSLHILVAEDNVINQIVLRKILEKRGFTVDVAEDGRQAFEMNAQHGYDLIFMDVQMPGMNGLEATAAIRAEQPAEEQPVIVAVTANALKGDRERCLEAGMDEYISKPLRSDSILKVIRKFFAEQE